MALVNSLLTLFTKAIDIANSANVVEKSKVNAVKEEANSIFQV
jgi:hypothetical protein